MRCGYGSCILASLHGLSVSLGSHRFLWSPNIFTINALCLSYSECVSVAYNQEALTETLLCATQTQGRRWTYHPGFIEQMLSFKEEHGPVFSPRLVYIGNCASLGTYYNISKLHLRNYIKMAIVVLPLSRVVTKAKWTHVYGRVWLALSCCW